MKIEEDLNSVIEDLNFVIKNLSIAITVAYEAPEIESQGYAYAAGYSRSAMLGAVEDLNCILSKLRQNS